MPGSQSGAEPLVADSRETLACALLSIALLAGLGANYLFGFWRADPLAGLLIVLFLFREGYEGWRESGSGQERDSMERGTGRQSAPLFTGS